MALVGAEVVLRYEELRPKGARADRDSWHVFDPLLGWRAKPGWEGQGSTPGPDPVRFSVRTNARGLRMDRPVTPRPPDGVKRICLVGDSFTFGYGVEVEEGCVARLDALLGDGVEVLNMGTCAYGVDQMRLVVEEQALPLEPDLILVGVIDQNFRRALRVVSHTGHAKPRYVLTGDGGVRLVNVPLPEPPPEGELRYADHPPEGGSFLLWKLGELGDRIRIALAGGAESARPRWRLGEAILRDATRAAAEAGVPLVVVHYPTVGALLDEEGEPLRPLLDEHPDLTVCDVFPAFEAHGADPSPLYLPDTHPSAEGQRLMAEAMAEYLRGHPELLAE